MKTANIGFGKFEEDFYANPNTMFIKSNKPDIDKELNKCALEMVKNHIVVKINEMKEAEKKAITEGRIQSQIDMYHDAYCLWLYLLEQMLDLEVNL